jgi:hypothetical protein
MNKFIQLVFKKYVPGALLMVLLLSPLQSHAALLADDIAVFRQQVKLLTEAIETSTAITQTKKNELESVVSAIINSLGLLELQVQANPAADSSRRVNVEKVTVTGNAKNFTAQVVVEWGPEVVGGTSYGPETSTYNYNFITTLAEAAKVARLTELSSLIFDQLSAEIGISALRLKDKATITFSRFSGYNDALRNYNPPQRSKGLEKYFGRFSIVDRIDVEAGRTGFSFSLRTDQEESLRLAVAPNGDTFTSSLSYWTYGDRRTSRTDSTTSRADMQAAFTPLFAGTGNLFNTSDSTVVDDLVLFAMNNEVFYERNSLTPAERIRGEALECYPNRIKDIVEAIMVFYARENFQTADNIAFNLFAKIALPDVPSIVLASGPIGDNECKGDGNDFFLTIGSLDV